MRRAAYLCPVGDPSGNVNQGAIFADLRRTPMKKFLLATAALVVVAANPASAASCCGKKDGMCMKAGTSMSMAGKKGCCCEAMGMNMSKRKHQH
jgi:hypothetical protein